MIIISYLLEITIEIRRNTAAGPRHVTRDGNNSSGRAKSGTSKAFAGEMTCFSVSLV